MEKIIVLGDIHGRQTWKLALQTQEWDKAIFIGDYFDSHDDISPELQMLNFREICQYKEAYKEREIILLIGNHDEHYFPFMGNSSTSGYNTRAAPAIGHLLMTYKDLLQMAHSEGDILFSHAGIGEKWLLNSYPEIELGYPFNNAKDIADKTNEIWQNKPLSFKFNGGINDPQYYSYSDPTGDNVGQTPIWIRPKALLQDTKTIRKSGIIQIIGHTQVNKIDIEGSKKNTNGKIIMIDALGTSGEYLIIENKQFKIGKI